MITCRCFLMNDGLTVAVVIPFRLMAFLPLRLFCMSGVFDLWASSMKTVGKLGLLTTVWAGVVPGITPLIGGDGRLEFTDITDIAELSVDIEERGDAAIDTGEVGELLAELLLLYTGLRLTSIGANPISLR